MEPKQFGELIRRLRIKSGLSIRGLQKLSGVSNGYLSLLETGKRGVPSPDILKSIAPHLNVSYEELMRYAGYMENHADIAFFYEKRYPNPISRARSKQILDSIIKRCIELGISDVDVALEAGILDLEWWNSIKSGELSFEFSDKRIEAFTRLVKLSVQELERGDWNAKDINIDEMEFVRWVKSMIGEDFFSDWCSRSHHKKELYIKGLEALYSMDIDN